VDIGDEHVVGSFVVIGNSHCRLNNTLFTYLNASPNECTVGDNVFIGPNTTLLNDLYPVSQKLRPVIIANKAIIGGGVIIMADVRIGENSFVAGASVVTKDVPPNTACKGLPARPYEEKMEYDTKKRRYEAGPGKVRRVNIT